MRSWRVCVDGEGIPLSITLSSKIYIYGYHWAKPSFTTNPGTPPETKWVHFINAVDELEAYKKVLGLPRK